MRMRGWGEGEDGAAEPRGGCADAAEEGEGRGEEKRKGVGEAKVWMDEMDGGLGTRARRTGLFAQRTLPNWAARD